EFISEIAGAIVPPDAERHRIQSRGAINHEGAEPLKPSGFVRDDDSGHRFARLGDWFRHHAPFFKHARTNSSTVACVPSTAWAARMESWASICLNPSATRASTASLMRCSSVDNPCFALAASHAPAMPILSFNSTTMRSAVFLPTPEILESDLRSPLATAPRKAVTLMPLRTFNAVLGPMPLTVWMRRRNRSRSSELMNP